MSTSQTINGLQHYLPDSTNAEFGAVLSSLVAGMAYKQTALVVFSGASGLSASVTAYLIPAGYAAVASSELFWRAPFTGKLLQAGLYVRARTAPDAQLTLDLRKNGSSITGNAVLSSGATTETTGQLTSTSVSAGDTLSISVTPAGGYTSGGADLSVTLCLVAA